MRKGRYRDTASRFNVIRPAGRDHPPMNAEPADLSGEQRRITGCERRMGDNDGKSGRGPFQDAADGFRRQQQPQDRSLGCDRITGQ
jgi:hypothetical protein